MNVAVIHNRLQVRLGCPVLNSIRIVVDHSMRYLVDAFTNRNQIPQLHHASVQRFHMTHTYET
jgi:hypothetical protein